MNLDDELKAEFARQEPSPDFADRVLARVAAAPVRRTSPIYSRWIAAAAAALLLAAGTVEYRRYEGERAKSQVLIAVRIAGGKLNKAQKKIQMLSHRSIS